MTTLFDLLDAPVLTVLTVAPACMHGATLTFASGGWTGGCRYVAATLLDQPGRVASCRYQTLWVEAKERDPLRGEPWLHFTRRASADSHQREGLTDAAAKTLRAQLAAAFAGDRFEQAWRATQATAYDPTSVYSAPATRAATARAHAEWWQAMTDLADLVHAHHATIVYEPIVTPVGQHPLAVMRPSEQNPLSDTWAHPHARLLLHGEHVGYIDQGGGLLPLAQLRRVHT